MSAPDGSARRLRLIANGALCNATYQLAHRKRGFDQSQTLVLFGAMRSGSTWLAELLSMVPRHLQLFEPLHPAYVPAAGRAIPHRDYFVAPEREWPEGRALFQDVISGRLVNSWILSQSRPGKVLAAKRLVVKMVRGNLLLPWFVQHIATLPPVMVIRHPCAIVASQLQKGWIPGRRLILSNDYLGLYPELRESCQALSTPTELLALAWCLRYHAPLRLTPRNRYLLVTYENLVRNGEQVLTEMFRELGLDPALAPVGELTNPSDTSVDQSAIRHGGDPLTQWQRHLTAAQIKEVLSVLAIFSMNFYSDAPVPNRISLQQFQAPAA